MICAQRIDADEHDSLEATVRSRAARLSGGQSDQQRATQRASEPV
jgi:hypothetical protein